MEPLKLPPCDLRLKNEEGNEYVFDIVRKKYVVMTPEEWVRQHFVHLMINHLGYPKTLMRIESGLTYAKSNKRSDITLMDRDKGIFLLVECKATDVKIDLKTVNQVSIYNKTLGAKNIAVTNGLKHFIWAFDGEEYHQMKTFPAYPLI